MHDELQVCNDPGVGADVSFMSSLLYNSSNPNSLASFYQQNSGGRVHFGPDTSTIVNVRELYLQDSIFACMHGL